MGRVHLQNFSPRNRRCSLPPMGFHSNAARDKASPDVSLWYPIDPDPIFRCTSLCTAERKLYRVPGEGERNSIAGSPDS